MGLKPRAEELNKLAQKLKNLTTSFYEQIQGDLTRLSSIS